MGQRGAASLCYRNRAEITFLMCEQKPYPVVFIPLQKLKCVHSLTRPATAEVIMASPAATSVHNVADQTFAS